MLLGLARITDFDLNVRIEPADEAAARPSGEVQPGSTAHVAMSKLGSPMDYVWGDFKRVRSFASPQEPAR